MDVGDHGHADPDGFVFSAFSVIKRQPPNDNGDFGDQDGPDNDDDGEFDDRRTHREQGAHKEDLSEFQLVHSRNIEVVKIGGRSVAKSHVSISPTLLCNCIFIEGKDVEVFDRLLFGVEKRGDEPIDEKLVQAISKRVPKAWQYNRAIHSAFKNWIAGEVRKLVTYGVNGGLDAWRRLCHEFFPVDQTKQDSISIEIASFKGTGVRALLTKIKME